MRNAVLILALGLGLSSCAQALDAQVQSINTLRLREAVTAYEQARTGGQPLDLCVKAKLVAIAYEDAREPANASAWRAREKEDCQAAVAAMGLELPARPAD